MLLFAVGERDGVAVVEDELRGECFEDGAWVADYRWLRFHAVRSAE